MVTRMEEMSGVALSATARCSSPAAWSPRPTPGCSTGRPMPCAAPPRPRSVTSEKSRRARRRVEVLTPLVDAERLQGVDGHGGGPTPRRRPSGRGRRRLRPSTGRHAGWAGGFDRLGYSVRRQRIAVPAGNSWGVPVPSGRSVNVIATPPDFEPRGAAPDRGRAPGHGAAGAGAEDNASGVGVLLAAAEAVATARTRLPVVFIAFGAEEPRSLTDPEQHHFGSRAYVAALSPRERAAVRGVISLDRVGVGAVVPVGSAYDTDPIQRQLLAAARRAGVPTTPDADQRSSDHWSFVRAGMPGARLGSTSYAAYHSAEDVVLRGRAGPTGSRRPPRAAVAGPLTLDGACPKAQDAKENSRSRLRGHSEGPPCVVIPLVPRVSSSGSLPALRWGPAAC